MLLQPARGAPGQLHVRVVHMQVTLVLHHSGRLRTASQVLPPSGIAVPRCGSEDTVNTHHHPRHPTCRARNSRSGRPLCEARGLAPVTTGGATGTFTRPLSTISLATRKSLWTTSTGQPLVDRPGRTPLLCDAPHQPSADRLPTGVERLPRGDGLAATRNSPPVVLSRSGIAPPPPAESKAGDCCSFS